MIVSASRRGVLGWRARALGAISQGRAAASVGCDPALLERRSWRPAAARAPFTTNTELPGLLGGRAQHVSPAAALATGRLLQLATDGSACAQPQWSPFARAGRRHRASGRAGFSTDASAARSAAAKPGEDEGDEGEGRGLHTKTRWLRKLGWHPTQLEAGKGYNRYLLVPAAMTNHLCMGSVFAWSIFNQPLTRLNGVLVPAANDWSMGDISITFSLVMGGFVWGALLGKTLDAWGPRASCLVGGTCLASGFGLGALAIQLHSLPLLYLGGAVWGLANAWSYVPPVATLLKWFPDRKGFASGATIMGYGGGAMIAAPLFSHLLDKFHTAPTRLGSAAEVAVTNERGVLFADVAGELKEVVVATAADAKLYDLAEGVYIAGSGSTGAAETFLTLGAGYGLAMAAASFVYRLPKSGWVPPSVEAAREANPDAAADDPQKPQLTTHSVSVATGTKLPQFWLLWTGFGFAITGSYGIISMGKTMVGDAFASQMPDIVTAGFTGTFVAAMSASNMGGRIFWSNMSDYVGRKLGGDPFRGRKIIFGAMWGIGAPLYGAIVWSIHRAAEHPGVLPLGVFCGSVFLILASFGGAAATRPAMTGDVFGTKHVGVMTARQLSVVMPAAFLGPKIATTLRASSMNEAMADLTAKIDESAFVQAFGAGREQLDELVAAHTVTINRLMELVPEGTADPTPFIYDKTMLVMAGLQACAFLTNTMLKPIDKKYHEPVDADAGVGR